MVLSSLSRGSHRWFHDLVHVGLWHLSDKLAISELPHQLLVPQDVLVSYVGVVRILVWSSASAIELLDCLKVVLRQ